ncbi:hypothetical protein RQM47_16855 [Rubrivirga sp. S365]|uniref:hypothetical protein n=1 Tax=Rubrivirga sp. S365 TaxID=3076080 RepID=UPI0028C733FB|nr:hypothetical protein [Rubrivirga sp. S365]MDT7858321.1 hypothetical protein [Rubrivirga sp. S365]
MPSSRVGHRGQIAVPKAVHQSLRDLRGSVPVDGPQDFGAVRAAVVATFGLDRSRRSGGLDQRPS